MDVCREEQADGKAILENTKDSIFVWHQGAEGTKGGKLNQLVPVPFHKKRLTWSTSATKFLNSTQKICTNVLHGIAICRLCWKVFHISTDVLHGVYQFCCTCWSVQAILLEMHWDSPWVRHCNKNLLKCRQLACGNFSITEVLIWCKLGVR